MPTDLFLAQSPPANLLPVRFDLGAAQAAISALRAGARAVEHGAKSRVADAKDAEQHWSGGQRQLFDRIERQVAQDAADLSRRMDDAADKIADEVKAVRAVNVRRADDLATWKQDLADARRRQVDAQNRARTEG